jgi:hypothetical protein
MGDAPSAGDTGGGQNIDASGQARGESPSSAGFQVSEVFVPLTLSPIVNGISSPGGFPQPLLEEFGGSTRMDPSASVGAESWACDGVLQAMQSNLVTSRHACPGLAPTRCRTVTPRVSKPHDYANHMFMRL